MCVVNSEEAKFKGVYQSTGIERERPVFTGLAPPLLDFLAGAAFGLAAEAADLAGLLYLVPADLEVFVVLGVFIFVAHFLEGVGGSLAGTGSAFSARGSSFVS